MAKLEDFRHQPGKKLLTEFGSPIMVIQLAAGMIPPGGRPSGGLETVAIVGLWSGEACFLHGSIYVEE